MLVSCLFLVSSLTCSGSPSWGSDPKGYKAHSGEHIGRCFIHQTPFVTNHRSCCHLAWLCCHPVSLLLLNSIYTILSVYQSIFSLEICVCISLLMIMMMIVMFPHNVIEQKKILVFHCLSFKVERNKKINILKLFHDGTSCLPGISSTHTHTHKHYTEQYELTLAIIVYEIDG